MEALRKIPFTKQRISKRFLPPQLNEFINSQSTSESTRKDKRNHLSHFLKYLSHHFFNGCEVEAINLSLITDNQLHHYREELVTSKRIESAKYALHTVRSYLNYIGIKHLNHCLLVQKASEIDKSEIIIIQQFLKYLQDFKKFSQIKNYRKHLVLFQKHLSKHFNLNFNSKYNFAEIEHQHILHYQRFLLKRVENKQITSVYAYAVLRTIKLFFKYLMREKISDIHYCPPRFMQRNPNRRNDYVEATELKVMIQSVFECTTDIRLAYRNLCIVLIMIFTGCRALEVCNLRLEDLWRTEYAALFRSKKSKSRKLTMDRLVMQSINEYLNFRDSFAPVDRTLFVKQDGQPITSRTVGSIFQKINIHAFGTAKHPPVALRHTYITNALEAGYDLRKVAKAAGHKILSSTDWYRHKSSTRLKNNTLKYDPTEKFKEEFIGNEPGS